MTFYASAPASLMVMGEHAVLHNYPALVQAMEGRIICRLTPNEQTVVQVNTMMGPYRFDWNDVKKPQAEVTGDFFSVLPPCSGLEFVRATLAYMTQDLWGKGLTITIESTIDPNVGLGSSSAVTVAILGVLVPFLNLSWDQYRYIDAGRTIIRWVQGAGSGADIAASVLGGLIAYRQDPLEARRIISPFLDLNLALLPIYSGYKIPTRYVLAMVDSNCRLSQTYKAQLHSLGNLSQQAIDALDRGELMDFFDVYKNAQQVMKGLGLSSFMLDAIVAYFEDRGIGAKISGSGLGDCILAIGPVEVLAPLKIIGVYKGPGVIVDTHPTNQGLHQDSIND